MWFFALPVLLAAGGCFDDEEPVVRGAATCEPSPAPLAPVTCTPGENPFQTGTPGELPGDLAGPLTLPALGGEFDLASAWTGCGAFVFHVHWPGSPRSESLLRLFGLRPLFERSPDGAHYVFLVATQDADEAREIAEYYQAVADRQLTDARERFAGRLHFVTAPVLSDGGWVTSLLRSWPPVADGFETPGFVIDRFQRLRELGSLSYPAAEGWPNHPSMLAAAASYEDRNRELEQRLAGDGAKVIPVFEKDRVAGEVRATIDLPDLSAHDQLALDLRLSCPDGFDRTCGEWDYLVYLHLCESEEGECKVELGRWITSYHRGGRWVTDVTPLLAFLGKGPHTFRFSSSNHYDVDLSLRLRQTCSGLRPVQAIPLWKGGAFDASYNPGHPPITVDVPAGARRVQLVAVTTGHGFGDDTENCAEFCNHQHRFQAGSGPEWVQEFPEAGTLQGCLQRVAEGVTPNQFGTWIFGRGGWCPGFDVPPFVADLTPDVTPGAPVELRYRATFQGQDFRPRRVEGGSGFAGRIDLESFLVIWK